MKTLTLSDMDVQVIVDALRFKTAVLINELLAQQEVVDQQEVVAPVNTVTVAPKYGLKKDGTPRKAPGRPRK